MTEAKRAYDPIPDLAALIDELRAVAASGTGPDHHYHSGLVQRLVDLLAGPYARLLGGLLLDEPGREHIITEAAIREALAPYITKAGKLLTPAELDALAAEAERGYDPAGFTVPPGHTRAGHTADGPADCARCQLLRENAHWMALPGTGDPEGP